MNLEEQSDVVLTFGQTLHVNGQSTDDTLAATERPSNSFGLRATIIPTWGELQLEATEGTTRLVSLVPASPTGVHMERVASAMKAIDEVTAAHLPPTAALQEIGAISHAPPSPTWLFALAAAAGAASLSVLYGIQHTGAVMLIVLSAAAGAVLRRILAHHSTAIRSANLTEEDIDDLEDAPDAEVEETEETVVDQATAARTIAELQAEVEILKGLEALALKVRRSGTDKKWEELSSLLQNHAEMFDAQGHRRKMVIFTEHRDTLNYLTERLRALLGAPEALVTVHGGMGREERTKAQEAFRTFSFCWPPTPPAKASTSSARIWSTMICPGILTDLNSGSAAFTVLGRPKYAISGTSWRKRPVKATFTNACSRRSSWSGRRLAAGSSTSWANCSANSGSAICSSKQSGMVTARRSEPACIRSLTT
jgi:hypothetical protein